MGYPSISNFDKTFINRTLENLEKDIPYPFTHLLNSLIGLIILPLQWSIQGRRELEFTKKEISVFDELFFLTETTFYTNKEGENVQTKKLYFKYEDKVVLTVGMLLKKLRNSIAHQAIRPTKENDDWRGVIFRNYSNERKTYEWGENYDLQLYLTKNEIELFAKFIAEKYLEEIKPKE